MDLNHLNLRVRDTGSCRRFYERHFGFRLAYEAEGGFFLRNDDGFLLAMVPGDPHHALPDGFHIGFGLNSPDEVRHLHGQLVAAGGRTTPVEDCRPQEDYVTFRCWGPGRDRDRGLLAGPVEARSQASVCRGVARHSTLGPPSCAIHPLMRRRLWRNEVKCHMMMEFFENARRSDSLFPLQIVLPSTHLATVRRTRRWSDTSRG
jgi:catechol 2,3-dioxygenase-like lactoylglutathione lyase family enzyme